MKSLSRAPLPAAKRRQLQSDAADIRSAASRKGSGCDNEAEEAWYAKTHFELGCWLFHYSTRVGEADGLRDRIDCAARIFEAGITHLHYEFYTVFDFGERHFDTIFEMGDSREVLTGLRFRMEKDSTGEIAKAFKYHGWPIEEPPRTNDDLASGETGWLFV